MATDHPTSLAARALGAVDPRDRLRAISALRGELDELEVDAVRGAIRDGSSWSQVADALGISKQSAHRRHSKRIDELPAPRPRPRPRPRAARPEPSGHIVVTAQSRRAVRAARAAARVLEHSSVDPAHMLLGLMADTTGAAAIALGAIGVEFEAARDAVARLGLPATRSGASAKRRVPISDGARAALEQSLREAQRLGHEHLGVEHLLLALLRDEHGGAVRALAEVGISADDLERCLGKVLKEAPFSSR
jgi:hypothetical protein